MKKGTETVVDRIFITGVAPITLDSLTSGFNIGTDITQDVRFNEMMGFTKNELIEILNSQDILKEEQDFTSLQVHIFHIDDLLNFESELATEIFHLVYIGT